MVHAKDSIVTLSNNTVITSRESLFDTLKTRWSFTVNVITTFENGVVLHSNYMKAITRPIPQYHHSV